MTDRAAILLAGGTGDLGGRIAEALVRRGPDVRALVRRGTAADRIDRLRKLGVTVVEADFADAAAMQAACTGVSCVVSALSGLHGVIVETQTRLLEAAVRAGVPRFIPSNFSMDFSSLPVGENRNFDLRREFARRLDTAPIAATSILNGAFADLLTGMAPIILFKPKRIVYWQDADQVMDFTTKDDVAAFTAAAAIGSPTPRTLRIAGDQVSARDLRSLMSDLTGTDFRLFRAGGLGRLATLATVTRVLFPQHREVFPAWQGMQYLHGMFSGLGKLSPLDNLRYPGLTWTSARDVLLAR